MAFNRFMTRNPMQFDFYKEPLDVLSQALQVRQQTYDKNAALADQLLSQSINSLDADRARANSIVRGYQQSIDKLAEEYGGDYAKMGKELMGLARKVRKDFTSGGEAFSIEYNKNLYDKWLDFSQKAALSGRGPSVQQVNLGSQYILGNYGGVGYNTETGTFNTLNTPQLVEYQEMSDLVDQFAKNVVPEKVASGEWEVDPNGLIWEKNKVGIVQVTPERIAAVVRDGLNGHQGWRAYEQQMKQFGAPITDEMYNTQVRRAVNTYAYKWIETDQDIMVNPIEEYKRKKSMEEQEAAPSLTGYSTGARSAAGGVPEEFDFNDFKTQALSYSYDANTGSNYDPSMMGEERRGGTRTNPQIKTFKEYVARPQFQQKYGTVGINLYSVLAKDKNFVSKSEEEKGKIFRDKYAIAASEFNRTQDYNLTLTTQARKSLNEQYLNPAFAQSAHYTIIDRKTGKTVTEATVADMAELIDIKGPDLLQKDAKWFMNQLTSPESSIQSIVTPTSGLNFGLEVNAPKLSNKYRVIMHNYDAKAMEVGNNLKTLYEPYLGKTTESNYVPITGLGMGNYAAKVKVNPQFDSEGNFKSKNDVIYFRKFQTDPTTGQPLVNSAGEYVFDGEEFPTSFTMHDLMESEYKSANLNYQTIKAADVKN